MFEKLLFTRSFVIPTALRIPNPCNFPSSNDFWSSNLNKEVARFLSKSKWNLSIEAMKLMQNRRQALINGGGRLVSDRHYLATWCPFLTFSARLSTRVTLAALSTFAFHITSEAKIASMVVSGEAAVEEITAEYPVFSKSWPIEEYMHHVFVHCCTGRTERVVL